MKTTDTKNRQLSLFDNSLFDTSNEDKEENNIPKASPSARIRPRAYHPALFDRLAQSKFRSSFHLKVKDVSYIQDKGLDTIRRHATDFIRQRLAPAALPNDGKQTPYRGHPVFLAQHATGCCCRGCFSKWHNISAAKNLSAEEQEYAVDIIMEWIEREYQTYMHK